MQSFHFGRQGEIDSLERRTHDDPTPGKGEVLVRLHASSLNYRDIMILEGRYGRVPFIPGLVPLSDAAGEVVAVGEGVSRFRPGDRVVATALPRWQAGKISPDVLIDQPGANRPGVLATLKVVHEDGLVALPAPLSSIVFARPSIRCLPLPRRERLIAISRADRISARSSFGTMAEAIIHHLHRSFAIRSSRCPTSRRHGGPLPAADSCRLSPSIPTDPA